VMMEDGAGLGRGDQVYLNGVQVGTVRQVNLNPPEGVTVRINVDDEIRLPADTRVVVSSDVFGATIVQLLPGRALVALEGGDTIQGITRQALPELATDLGDQARRIMASADSLLSPGAVNDLKATASVLPEVAQQLRAFRGTAQGQRETRAGFSRHEMVMDHQAQKLADVDIQDLAAYYAGLACPLPDPKKAVPAVKPPKLANRCTACHGAEGRGGSPTVPRLAGQQLRYLQNQLRSFYQAVKDGAGDKARRWRSHPIMAGQVNRASLPELMKVAEYFSSQRCR